MARTSFIYDIKTDDFYKDIVEHVSARFDTSGYSKNHPISIGVNKKVIGLMKDELGGRIMTEFVVIRPKLYAYKVPQWEWRQEVQRSQEVHCRENARL